MTCSFHTDTQGLGASPTCGPIKCSGGLLTLCIQLAISTEQQHAGWMGGWYQEGLGGATHDCSHLWPDLNCKAREAWKCRTVQTPCISEVRRAYPSFCPCICAAKSIHLQEEYPEKRMKVCHGNQHSPSKDYEKRKHCPLISKVSLLTVQTNFLPVLLLQKNNTSFWSHLDGAVPTLMTTMSPGQNRKGWYLQILAGKHQQDQHNGDLTGFPSLITAFS